MDAVPIDAHKVAMVVGLQLTANSFPSRLVAVRSRVASIELVRPGIVVSEQSFRVVAATISVKGFRFFLGEENQLDVGHIQSAADVSVWLAVRNDFPSGLFKGNRLTR